MKLLGMWYYYNCSFACGFCVLKCNFSPREANNLNNIIVSCKTIDCITHIDEYLIGSSFSTSPPGTDILDFPYSSKIELPVCHKEFGRFLISLIKLSEAEPYATGIGNDILGPRCVSMHNYVMFLISSF